MRTGYAIARLNSLEHGDWLEVRCVCGHVGTLNPVDLRHLPPMTPLSALEPRYLCTRCRRRGRVVAAVLNNQ